jgi:hypothetical protein
MPPPPPRQTRPDIVHSSIYVPKAAYRKLREIALGRECKVHDLVAIEPQIERGHGGLKTCELGPAGREGAGRVSQLQEMPDAWGEEGEARLPG